MSPPILGGKILFMTETNAPAAPNAIETAANVHRLTADGTGTVCNPTKLPKGHLVVAGPQFDKDGNRTGLRRVVCNKCNKVNPRGL